ncbi:MAG: hypothetical protein RLZ10_587 [Bacteroidota bacterium]|jgi:hypothetical protein
MSELKIQTAKIELKKGDVVYIKKLKCNAVILDFFKGEQTVLEVRLVDKIKAYIYLEDIEKVITK